MNGEKKKLFEIREATVVVLRYACKQNVDLGPNGQWNQISNPSLQYERDLNNKQDCFTRDPSRSIILEILFRFTT